MKIKYTSKDETIFGAPDLLFRSHAKWFLRNLKLLLKERLDIESEIKNKTKELKIDGGFTVKVLEKGTESNLSQLTVKREEKSDEHLFKLIKLITEAMAILPHKTNPNIDLR